MYSRHRFPSEIMSHCVWLYYTFPLSYRAIEQMMLYRGIEVTYETIREWCQKFGQQYANQLRLYVAKEQKPTLRLNSLLQRKCSLEFCRYSCRSERNPCLLGD